MNNYERITTAGLYALTDLLGVRMIGLLNPSTCEGCPVYDECRKQDDDEYTSCIDTVKRWLRSPYNGYPRAMDAIRDSSPKQIADFLGAIGHHIYDEMNCGDCPAEHICHNSIAESCEEAFRLWLEDEAEEEGSAEEPEKEDRVEEWESEDEAIAAWNRRVSGWISVEDNMPGVGVPVLCFTTAKYYTVMHIQWAGIWGNSNCQCYPKDFVTHWMPLPEPPDKEA